MSAQRASIHRIPVSAAPRPSTHPEPSFRVRPTAAGGATSTCPMAVGQLSGVLSCLLTAAACPASHCPAIQSFARNALGPPKSTATLPLLNNPCDPQDPRSPAQPRRICRNDNPPLGRIWFIPVTAFGDDGATGHAPSPCPPLLYARMRHPVPVGCQTMSWALGATVGVCAPRWPMRTMFGARPDLGQLKTDCKRKLPTSYERKQPSNRRKKRQISRTWHGQSSTTQQHPTSDPQQAESQAGMQKIVQFPNSLVALLPPPAQLHLRPKFHSGGGDMAPLAFNDELRIANYQIMMSLLLIIITYYYLLLLCYTDPAHHQASPQIGKEIPTNWRTNRQTDFSPKKVRSALDLSAGKKSPRREVVRSSAGAGVVYPPFLGSFA